MTYTTTQHGGLLFASKGFLSFKDFPFHVCKDTKND